MKQQELSPDFEALPAVRASSLWHLIRLNKRDREIVASRVEAQRVAITSCVNESNGRAFVEAHNARLSLERERKTLASRIKGLTPFSEQPKVSRETERPKIRLVK